MTRTDAWAKPGGPKYIVGVTNFVHRETLPKHASRAAIYRCVLQNLRLLPDPVIWAHVIPSLRKLCASPTKDKGRHGNGDGSANGPVSEADLRAAQTRTEAERKKTLGLAKDSLSAVRAAVACHPHALERLIRESYGIKGPRRHGRYREVAKSSPLQNGERPNEAKLGPGRPAVPIPLTPLLRVPRPIERDAFDETQGESSSGRQVKTQWQREVDGVEVPLAMPQGTGVVTGLEKSGVVETFQAFAKVGKAYEQYGDPQMEDVISHYSEREQPTNPAFTTYDLPHTFNLPSYHHLSPVLQKIFPVKLRPTRREPVMPRPPRHETKLNPKTWRHPVRLTPRLVTRTYQRLWDGLSWVRPQGEAVDGPWVKCSYEEVLLWQRKEWDALKAAENKSKAGFRPAIQARFSNMTPQEEYWTKHKKGRKGTKATIDRLLDKRTRWDERE